MTAEMNNDKLRDSASPPADASLSAPSVVDPNMFRRVLGTFLSGVTVVTAFDAAGRPRGLTANSFSSVSLDPPLILVCIARASSCFDVLQTAPRFGVNILGDWQKDISASFATSSPTKFESVEYDSTQDGPPLIRNCLSGLDCARHDIFDAGDHAIVVGRVIGFAVNSGGPLGFYRGQYLTLGEGVQALEQHRGDAIVVAAIIDDGGQVLLWQPPGAARWSVPSVPLRAGQYHRQVLPSLLKRIGVQGDISLLFSVFQDRDDPHTTMVFRGEANGTAAESMLPDGTRLRLFSEAERPWEMMAGTSQPDVVRRYFRERMAARFGIYWDTADHSGRVASFEGEPRPWRARGSQS